MAVDTNSASIAIMSSGPGKVLGRRGMAAVRICGCRGFGNCQINTDGSTGWMLSDGTMCRALALVDAAAVGRGPDRRTAEYNRMQGVLYSCENNRRKRTITRK